MRLTFDLPYPIPRALSPNGRAHWRVVSREKTELSNTTIGTLRAVAAPLPCGKPVTLTYAVHHAGIPPDRDNLIASLKAAQDGIANVLEIDDAPNMIRGVDVEYVKVPKRNQQRILVTITTLQ